MLNPYPHNIQESLKMLGTGVLVFEVLGSVSVKTVLKKDKKI